MKKIIILVAGMAGTGKSTTARGIAQRLGLPLVTYDNIKAKDWEIVEKYALHEKDVYGKCSYEFFWF